MEDHGDIRVPFSLDSPYLMTGEHEDVPDKDIDLDFLGHDERYLTPRATEMPSGTAMVGLLRSELAALFHETTADMIRLRRVEFTIKWSSLMGMSAFNETQPTLPRCYYFQSEPFSEPGSPEDYFNKSIAIYFQYTDDDDRSRRASSALIGRYVYRHWLRMYHGRPPFQRRHFLAKAIEFVQGDGVCSYKPLITDLPYVLAFHGSLCNSLVAREDDIKPTNQYMKRKTRKTGGVTGTLYPEYTCHRSDFGPCLSAGPLTYRQHGLRVSHIFRSLFMVVDGCHGDDTSSHKREEQRLCTDYNLRPAAQRSRNEQREISLDWLASRYRVLLVRTGDDGHLSAPVSFQPLFDSGRALPLDREDYCGYHWEDAVRVRLDHALEFVEALIRREREALPHVRRAAEVLEEEVEELCERWMERVLGHAAEVGVDNNGFTWLAIRRARARLNGEAFDMGQVAPEFEGLARWFLGG
ncbi:hypothetical protein CONLIGDRAFT_630260 [Coniochaeta ligniaria NRRL 30616]|uniref:Uncharacterized protein n=1 Tax=Coniochaeta ligniaria NRRL 30616 TaxID=1408157 RepID=A0A1J7JRI5_9PEZI|nr:hypothetical protein CONLIGDRAFT_630260 [Coniochaeta ligniaria NRRL 30616]